MKVGIIGGGAAGIMAAIAASDNGNEVTILEHMNRIGKKILSTGSGRCNLSNADMDLSHFHGGDLSLVSKVLDQFSKDDTLMFFGRMGLYTTGKNGYLYPYSEQASGVLDLLIQNLNKRNVSIITDCYVKNINASGDKDQPAFCIQTSKGDFLFDRLIIAAGSKSAPKTGSDGSGYVIAKKFGHKIIKPLPALCGLKCKEPFLKSLGGIRCKAAVSIYAGDELLSSETGELQINKTGISGIPVMQQSYIAGKALDKGEKVQALISFMPEFTEKSLFEYLLRRVNNNPEFYAKDFLVTLLNKNITAVILKQCSINPDLCIGDAKESQIKCLADKITHFTLNITETNSFEDSQVTCGGVSLMEVDENLQSKIVKGLYFAGEILDVNGDCGGYNLQWAWSSGYVAGSLKNA